MPFKLADGSPYFEGVEFLRSEGRELSENHVALCPTCAAKWRYANETSPEDLAIRVAEGSRS